MFYRAALLFALLASPAMAQEYIAPKIPTEAEKIEALKLAYIAIVGETPDDIPDSGPGVWPKLEKPKLVKRAEVESNICTRHHMRKLIRAKSWRCVR